MSNKCVCHLESAGERYEIMDATARAEIQEVANDLQMMGDDLDGVVDRIDDLDDSKVDKIVGKVSQVRIINSQGVEHSKGYGDACATEDYYDQYRGHVNSDIVITVPSPDFHDDQIADGCTDIGAISNSTFTSTAYQSAIKAAFAAFEKLTTEEGGND